MGDSYLHIGHETMQTLWLRKKRNKEKEQEQRKEALTKNRWVGVLFPFTASI